VCESKCGGTLERHFAWYARLSSLGHVPEDVAAGHREGALRRFEESRAFLESLPLEGVRRVLDVGLGYGLHCRWFAERGKETLGIDAALSPEAHGEAARRGYSVREMDMHHLELPDGTFDLVWSHHTLEHSFSPFAALLEWRRVLRPGGYLAITVPPHKSQVVSGHFTVGWSIGQLAYLLYCTGYDVEHGRFVREGYNVRGAGEETGAFQARRGGLAFQREAPDAGAAAQGLSPPPAKPRPVPVRRGPAEPVRGRVCRRTAGAGSK